MGANGEWSFDDEWPRLADGLQLALVRKGIPPWLRDDVVQETGLRLLRIRDKVDPDKSPAGLALAIARNVLWEDARRRGNREILGVVPERPDLCDVESAGIARVELGRVRRALPRLTETHRRVLLAEIGERPTLNGSRDAVKMMRMRARKRLSALMEQASASAGAVVMELRILAARTAEYARKSGVVCDAHGLAIGAGVFAIAVMFVPPSNDPNARPSDGKPERRLALQAAAKQVDDGGTRVQGLGRASPSHPRSPARGVRRDDRTPIGKRERGREKDPHRYGFSVGEGGPAEGEVKVHVISRGDDGRSATDRLPVCSAGESDSRVEVSCAVQTRSREVRAEAKVRVRPWDPTRQKR